MIKAKKVHIVEKASASRIRQILKISSASRKVAKIIIQKMFGNIDKKAK